MVSRGEQPLFTEASWVHCMKGPRLSCQPPALGSCWLSWALSRSSWDPLFHPWAKAYPISLRLHSLLCIYPEHSEQLHNDESEGVVKSITTVPFKPIKLYIWIPHLHKSGPIPKQGRNFSFVFLACTSDCHQRLWWVLQLANCSPESSFCFFRSPDWGMLLTVERWQPTFVDTVVLLFFSYFVVLFSPPDPFPWSPPGVCNAYIYRTIYHIYKIPLHPGQATSTGSQTCLSLTRAIPVVGGPQVSREDWGVAIREREGPLKWAAAGGESSRKNGAQREVAACSHSPQRSQTPASVFPVMTGEQLWKHLYLNLPSADVLKGGFSNAFHSSFSFTALWNEISNTLVGFWSRKQLEVQAETEQRESKAPEESVNGLGEGK